MLGLPAAPFSNESTTDIHGESGSDLKKRKRMLALQNGETFATEGDVGNIVIGSNVSHGGDVEMNVMADPIADEQIVAAGLDDQACLGK